LPRYERKLPIILSPTEVKLLLETPKNLAYRTMLTTMYAAGPRVSEVAKLKVPDIAAAQAFRIAARLLALEKATGLARAPK